MLTIPISINETYNYNVIIKNNILDNFVLLTETINNLISKNEKTFTNLINDFYDRSNEISFSIFKNLVSYKHLIKDNYHLTFSSLDLLSNKRSHSHITNDTFNYYINVVTELLTYWSTSYTHDHLDAFILKFLRTINDTKEFNTLLATIYRFNKKIIDDTHVIASCYLYYKSKEFTKDLITNYISLVTKEENEKYSTIHLSQIAYDLAVENTLSKQLLSEAIVMAGLHLNELLTKE